jgi:hypothetical protein
MKRSKSKSTTSLSNLPTEQCQHVLSFLTCSELLTLTLVSKAVKSIALKSHTLVAMDEDDGLLTSTRGSSAMLRKTILNGANLEPLTSHPRQRRWTVNGNAANNTSQRMSCSSSGHYHCMTEQNMINLLQRFKSLRVLKLSNFKQTTMESIIQIINTCPAASSLVHIEFHGVRLVQNKYSLQLPYHNRNLKHFILSGTIFCNYEDVLKSIVVSENLQTLYLDGCRSITDLNLKDMTTEQVLLNNDNGKIKQKPMLALKYLTLKNASKLIKPTIQCPSLIELNLSQCHILRDLSNIICPNLIDINLSQCSMVNDESIHSLLLSCPMIEVLLLSGCNSLNALNITSKRIRHIDMNLCIGLVTANIHCQAMEKLEVSYFLLTFDI